LCHDKFLILLKNYIPKNVFLNIFFLLKICLPNLIILGRRELFSKYRFLIKKIVKFNTLNENSSKCVNFFRELIKRTVWFA
jgi:hypothetical protein